MIQNAFFLWLLGAFLFFVLEIGHPGLCFFLSLSMGALAGATAAAFQATWLTQLGWYAGVTMFAFVVLRRIVRRSNRLRERSRYTTNIQALIGKRAVVIKLITKDAPGLVKIEGQVWRAQTSGGNKMRPDTPVQVVAVKGASLLVRPEIK
jgi:membrane protein implicated in regulation of membrane protease activity